MIKKNDPNSNPNNKKPFRLKKNPGSDTFIPDTDKDAYNNFTANQARIINGDDKNDEDSKEFLRLLHSNGIYKREDFDDFNSFYIFPRNDPYRMLGSTREYVFITKPDLHIFGQRNNMSEVTCTVNTTELNPELSGIVFFSDLIQRGYGESVLASLQHSAKITQGYNSPFINLLSNYKLSNLDLSNVSVGEEETAANIYNTRIFYRKPSDSADEDNEFSLEFKDNRYLDCYLWFKAYDLYEQYKYHGLVTPTNLEYTWYKVLSDQMTVFKFIVGEDGETIIHWSCLWGCFPKSVPRSTFSDMPTDGQLRFTTDWKATFQQDMDPAILIHYNAIVSDSLKGVDKGYYPEIPLFDESIGRVTGEKALYAKVERDRDYISNHDVYRLKWYGDKDLTIPDPNAKPTKPDTNKSKTDYSYYNNR